MSRHTLEPKAACASMTCNFSCTPTPPRGNSLVSSPDSTFMPKTLIRQVLWTKHVPQCQGHRRESSNPLALALRADSQRGDRCKSVFSHKHTDMSSGNRRHTGHPTCSLPHFSSSLCYHLSHLKPSVLWHQVTARMPRCLPSAVGRKHGALAGTMHWTCT